MSRIRFIGFVVAFGLMGVPAMVRAQAEQMPPMPKPGPEHALLKMDEGTWDAVVEVVPGPGAQPMTSKGVEVNTVGCGGLCLISDFKGEAMGMPFMGHGITTWDPAKKKYVGAWTDSMSTGVAIGESTYDAATKKWSGWMEAPDHTGKVVKSRSTGEMPNANTRIMTMFGPGPDGKEMQTLKITYTRRK
jgi:hypothetical protein